MLLKIGVGGVYLKRIHNKITKAMCYHYCFYATDTETCGLILALILSAACVYLVIFNFSFLTKVFCWRMYATCVWVCLCLYMADCKYWAILARLLTPLTFARHRLSPLAAFTSGAYSLDNGRRWQWICEFYTANFKGIFWRPVVIMCLAIRNNLLLVL